MARRSGNRRRESRREWGRVLAVRRTYVSRRVDVDAALGASEVVIRSGGVFEGSGTVQLNGQVVAYTDWAEATGILSLADPLTAAAVEGDDVFLYLPKRETIATDLEADVEIDDWDGEPLPALLAEGLDRVLPVGPRDLGEGEEVLVEYEPDDDEWYVIRTRGLAKVTGAKWEADDAYTLTLTDLGNGQFVAPLSHLPIDESVQASWGAVIQPPTEFVVDYDLGVVTWPLAGFEKAGDVFTFHYQYRDGVTVEPEFVAPPPPPEPLDLVQSGYLSYQRASVPEIDRVPGIPLPAGVAIGDFFIMGAHGQNSGGENMGFYEDGGDTQVFDPALGANVVEDRILGELLPTAKTVWFWGRLTHLEDFHVGVPFYGAMICGFFRDLNGGDETVIETSYVDRGGDQAMIPGYTTPFQRRALIICRVKDTGTGGGSSSFPSLGPEFTGVGGYKEMGIDYWTAPEDWDGTTVPVGSYVHHSNYQVYDLSMRTLGMGVEGEE